MAVRTVRWFLLTFAKARSAPFKLRYDKLLNGPKTYAYDTQAGSVKKIPRSDRLGSGPVVDWDSRKISALYCDACGILPKRVGLCSIISSCNANAILLTETWFSSEIKDREIFPDYPPFNVSRCDRAARRRSGVLIAVDRNIICRSGLLTMQFQVYLTRRLLPPS